MPRFVILEHRLPPEHGRPTHWDLMLEFGPVLRTWALFEPPALGTIVIAEQLADHRLAYLNYEGPVSNNRGEVVRWDQGMFSIDEQSERCLALRLRGERIAGRGVLERIPDDAQRWTFCWNAG